MRRQLFSRTFFAALLIAGAAHAQGADAALATDLFNAGRDLMAAGNFAAACPKLAESARLDAKVGTLARAAECEEKLGHMVNARARWQQAQNLAQAQGDTRLAHVQTEFARVDKLVPKLNLTLQGTPAPGLVIKVDELQLNSAAAGVPVPVEIGRHTITASAPGRAPWSTTVDATAESGSLTVTIPELAPEASPAAKPAAVVAAHDPAKPPEQSPAADTAPRSSNPLPTVGIIVAGAGLVALGVGAVFAVNASSKNDDSLSNGCTKNDCNATGAQLRNDARSAGDLATVLFVVGGVLMAGGLTTFLLAPSTTAGPSSARVRLVPRVGTNEGTMTFQGAW
jgi:hypothetical protein